MTAVERHQGRTIHTVPSEVQFILIHSKMPSLSYSILENTCPATPATATFEKLTFWTLGYGGWLGVSLLPLVWALPASKTLRTILSILALPTCAMIMTGVFSAVYIMSLFTYHMSIVMISPHFLHSCIGIVCLSVGSVGFYLAGNNIKILVNSVPDTEGSDVGDVGSESESESESEDAKSEDAESESAESAESESESESAESEDAESEDAESEGSEDIDTNKDAWRETANFEGVRTAAPLPE